MEIQEYPKALYKGGDVDAEHVIVHDAKEEGAKRKGGFKMLGEPEEKPKAKGGKPAEPEDKLQGSDAPAPAGDKAPE